MRLLWTLGDGEVEGTSKVQEDKLRNELRTRYAELTCVELLMLISATAAS